MKRFSFLGSVFFSLWILLYSHPLSAYFFYVSGIGGTSIIDTETQAIIGNISGGSGVGSVNPNQQFVYLPRGSGVLVLAVSTQSIVATIPTSNVSTGVITPNGQFLYSPGTVPNAVYAISTALNQIIATIPVGGAPTLSVPGGAALPNNQFVYLPSSANQVVKISTATNAVVATIAVSSEATAILATPNNVYVSLFGGVGSIEVISTSLNSIVATIAVATGSSPEQPGMTPDGQFIYYPSVVSDTVAVVSTASNTVTATLPFSGPIAAAVTPNGDLVYIGSLNLEDVYAVSTATHTVIATIDMGGSGITPDRLAITPDGALVYAISGYPITGTTDAAVAISTATQTAIATILLPPTLAPEGGVFASGESPPIPTPSDISPSGNQAANRFLTQTNFINTINWAPPINFTPVIYQIFRDSSLTDLAGTVSGSTLEFEDPNREKKRIYSYFIIAVDETGSTLEIGSVSVFPAS